MPVGSNWKFEYGFLEEDEEFLETVIPAKDAWDGNLTIKISENKSLEFQARTKNNGTGVKTSLSLPYISIKKGKWWKPWTWKIISHDGNLSAFFYSDLQIGTDFKIEYSVDDDDDDDDDAPICGTNVGLVKLGLFVETGIEKEASLSLELGTYARLCFDDIGAGATLKGEGIFFVPTNFYTRRPTSNMGGGIYIAGEAEGEVKIGLTAKLSVDLLGMQIAEVAVGAGGYASVNAGLSYLYVNDPKNPKVNANTFAIAGGIEAGVFAEGEVSAIKGKYSTSLFESKTPLVRFSGEL